MLAPRDHRFAATAPAGSARPSATIRWPRAIRALRPAIRIDRARSPLRRTAARRYQNFNVPYRKWMRVLDALNWIAENAATDLAYRWICGSKMCGTCAVRMNGREVLACWEAVEPAMTIEPLRNLPVIRDLVVDRSTVRRQGRAPRALDRAAGYLRGLSRAAHRTSR